MDDDPDEEQYRAFLAGLDPLARRLIEQMQSVDKVAQVCLKAHLVMEEALGAIIETFVFNPDQLEKAPLNFYTKVAVARSMSLDQAGNPIWELVLAINSLRNNLAHALDSPKRADRLNKVRQLYARELEGAQSSELRVPEKSDEEMIAGAAALCLGFIGTFLKEVQRFREAVNGMDRLMNPHRHAKPKPSS